jgi:hypothetical protein
MTQVNNRLSQRHITVSGRAKRLLLNRKPDLFAGSPNSRKTPLVSVAAINRMALRRSHLALSAARLASPLTLLIGMINDIS